MTNEQINEFETKIRQQTPISLSKHQKHITAEHLCGMTFEPHSAQIMLFLLAKLRELTA